MGSLLFLIYAIDIASCSPKHQLRLFADDSNLFVSEIQRASSVKHLGVYLDENLTWDAHINNVCSYLIKLTGVFNYVPNFVEKEYAIQIDYAYVYPHITYGIEAYGSSKYIITF